MNSSELEVLLRTYNGYDIEYVNRQFIRGLLRKQLLCEPEANPGKYLITDKGKALVEGILKSLEPVETNDRERVTDVGGELKWASPEQTGLFDWISNRVRLSDIGRIEQPFEFNSKTSLRVGVDYDKKTNSIQIKVYGRTDTEKSPGKIIYDYLSENYFGTSKKLHIRKSLNELLCCLSDGGDSLNFTIDDTGRLFNFYRKTGNQYTDPALETQGKKLEEIRSMNKKYILKKDLPIGKAGTCIDRLRSSSGTETLSFIQIGKAKCELPDWVSIWDWIEEVKPREFEIAIYPEGKMKVLRFPENFIENPDIEREIIKVREIIE